MNIKDNFLDYSLLTYTPRRIVTEVLGIWSVCEQVMGINLDGFDLESFGLDFWYLEFLHLHSFWVI